MGNARVIAFHGQLARDDCRLRVAKLWQNPGHSLPLSRDKWNFSLRYFSALMISHTHPHLYIQSRIHTHPPARTHTPINTHAPTQTHPLSHIHPPIPTNARTHTIRKIFRQKVSKQDKLSISIRQLASTHGGRSWGSRSTPPRNIVTVSRWLKDGQVLKRIYSPWVRGLKALHCLGWGMYKAEKHYTSMEKVCLLRRK